MKTLNTLIKKTKFELDIIRKKISELEKHRDHLQNTYKKLQEDLIKEKAFAINNINYGYILDNYISMNKMQQQHVDGQIKKIEKQILEVQAGLQELFAEQKRYEIALDIKIKAQIEEEKKLEIIELDEISSRQFSLESVQKDTYEE